MSALVFLYEQVLGRALGVIDGLVAAKKLRRVPTVLTREEVRAVLARVEEQPFALIVGLLYGTGMRLLECVRLRVKDIDFGYSQVIVHDGKGQKDRVVPLPQRCRADLEAQIAFVSALRNYPSSSYSRVQCATRSQECSTELWSSQTNHDATTMIYTHVLNRGGRGVVSPIDLA